MCPVCKSWNVWKVSSPPPKSRVCATCGKNKSLDNFSILARVCNSCKKKDQQRREVEEAIKKAERRERRERRKKELRDNVSPKRSKITSKNARVKAIEALGGKCVRCGFSDIRALQIDHKKNNGCYERKELNQDRLYKRVYELAISGKADTEYQVLCANCNWTKRYETS
jgi:hypothetical protein